MLEQYVSPHYQRCLVDALARYVGRYFSPIQITLFAGLCGLASMIFLAYGFPAAAILCLLVSGYADTLDGTVARLYGASSPIGAVLDILTDRLVEFALIFGLYLQDPASRSLMSMLMLGSILLCVTSFLVVGIFTANESEKGFHYSPGLMERAEAFIMFILMILLPPYFMPLSILFVLLVTLTTIIRVLEFSRYAKYSVLPPLT